MKFINRIAGILLLIVAIEGFNGEFREPTVFDLIKWICCIILVLCLIFSKKITRKEEE